MLQTSSARDRLLERVARTCARAQDPLDLFEQVAALVRGQIPYAAAGWLLVDPDTMLINGVYAEDVDRDQHLELIRCELTEDDVNKFWDLARRRVPAAALSISTDGDLSRSARWTSVYQPHGYGDEIRAVFATGRDAWGHACLTRSAPTPSSPPRTSSWSPGSRRTSATASAPATCSVTSPGASRSTPPRWWWSPTTAPWSR